MPLRKIVLYPDAKLREVSEPIADVNDDVRQLVQDMQETMYAKEGAGLAAIQVGVPLRLFIGDAVLAGGDREDPPLVFINPEILSEEGEQDGDEGCLSFPGIFVPIKRPNRVTIRATDIQGERFEMTGEGILARLFVHENEHLDGKLIVDRVGRLKREQIKRRMKRYRPEE